MRKGIIPLQKKTKTPSGCQRFSRGSMRFLFYDALRNTIDNNGKCCVVLSVLASCWRGWYFFLLGFCSACADVASGFLVRSLSY